MDYKEPFATEKDKEARAKSGQRDLYSQIYNCTRNSLHRHLTKCPSYRLENLWKQNPWPDVAQTSSSFLVLNTPDAFLHHQS